MSSRLSKARKRLYVAGFAAIALLALVVGAAVLLPRESALEAASAWAVSQFDAPTLSPTELAERMTGNGAPLVIDVRAPGEVAVSRLPGAIAWDESTDAPPPDEAIAALAEGRDIVVYCSIGYRSGRAADKLAAMKGDSVPTQRIENLEGGIFQWASEGRALDGGDKVHPFDATWGKLLPRELRSTLRE